LGWNPFKKKSIDRNRNIVDDLANKLQEKGATEKLEKELLTLKSTKLNDKEVEAWHHLYGICAFQKSDHELARKRFENGLEISPNSVQIKFSLAQEYIFLGSPDPAFTLFDDCLFPDLPREYVLYMSRYAYLHNEHQRGIEYLENFFNIYMDLKILDDHFLYVRGLPFFHLAWSCLAAHCILGNKTQFLEEMTDKIRSNCHDYDFSFLYIELKAILEDNYSLLIEPIKKNLEDNKKYKTPTGHNSLRIAIFESHSENNYEKAIQIIDSVQLDENDFHWLEDVRTLAKAFTARKFRKKDDENSLVDNFTSRQPLLFEHNHAVDFGLLIYQEELKNRVRFV